MQEYPTEHRDVTNQASQEKESGFRPELEIHIDNIDEYDLSGKTIIPFNSHSGSDFSQKVQSSITQLEPNADVQTNNSTTSRTVMASSKNAIINWLEKSA